jgi:hypothetical protein
VVQLPAGIDEQAGNCKVVSQRIFGYKELGQQEFNSSWLPMEDGTAGHSDAFREADCSEEGWKAMVTASKIVVLAAYKMLNNPAKVKEIRESFKEAKAKEGK